MSHPTPEFEPDEQWLQLISAYLDQSISSEEFNQLSQWITTSHDNALWFARLASLHNGLRTTLRDQDLREFLAGNDPANSLELAVDPQSIFDMMTKAERSGIQQSLPKNEIPGVSEVRPSRCVAASEPFQRRVWRRPTTALAIALSVLVACLATVRLSSDRQSSELADGSVIEPLSYVATLSEMRNCVWEPGSHEPSSGHLVTRGSKFHMVSGLAQVAFDTGAVSVVEGPAEFTLLENAMELDRGEVSTLVPGGASGFRVLTPSSETIDLGTSFGVRVDEFGGSQVHVFEGEVVSRQRNAAGAVVGEQFYVTTNNAIRFGPNSEQYVHLMADEESFARMLSDHPGEYAEMEPVVDKPLLLWLTSGHWIVDREQRVKVWRDTLSTSNGIPANALQAVPTSRPTVVEGEFNGHDVLRFDGADDFLVTTPFYSGNCQTVVFVASVGATSEVSPHDRRWSPQIISYNGPPQIDSNLGPAPNFLQISATAFTADRIALDAYVYAGYKFQSPPKGKYHIFAGEVSTEFPGDPARMQVDPMPMVGAPFVGIYVYNHVHSNTPELCTANLWINGQPAGWTSAPTPIAMTSRKVIGRHGGQPLQFCGDIAEVMIYDQGLDAGEVATLTKSLGEKYGIALPHSVQPEPSVPKK